MRDTGGTRLYLSGNQSLFLFVVYMLKLINLFRHFAKSLKPVIRHLYLRLKYVNCTKLSMKFLVFIIVLLMGSSCASIVTSGGWKDVRISSYPPNARFRIIDESGKQVAAGTTPQTVALKGGKPYFAQKRYTVQYNLEGYLGVNALIGSEFNAWYCANACFGGLIGWLIVDPITGAMYKLDKGFVEVTLVPYTPYKAEESVSENTSIKDTVISQINLLMQDSTTLKADKRLQKLDTIKLQNKLIKEFDYYPTPTKKDSL